VTKKKPRDAASTHTLKLALARHNAARHLALYQREPLGLLIFRAIAEYRRVGVQVPEELMQKLDAYTRALEMAASSAEAARGDAQVASAIEMGTINKKSGSARLKALERRRDVVEELMIREHELGQAAMVALRATAEEFGLTESVVANMKSEWKAKDSTSDEPSTPGGDLNAAWNSRSSGQ